MTPEAFLKALPQERAAELARVRAVIKQHLPPGYQETMAGDMIAYVVPLERYPDTYNGQALWYAALGTRRHGFTLHLMPVYGDKGSLKKLTDGFQRAGKKLEMGKACINFAKADDLALDTVGEIVASVPLERWIAIAKGARRR